MTEAKTKTRRRHSAELKQQILTECAQPGASVAGVALSHGINANVVHKWRRLAHAPCTQLRTDPRHPHRVAPWLHQRVADLAGLGRRALRGLDAGPAQVIRIDALWLATEPLDMRAGTESALARVVAVFGAARPHHAYLFANRRANRMKVLVHDGIGVWLAARRLNSGKFVWPREGGASAALSRPQFDALVLGLPWQRLGDGGVITVL